MSLHELGLISKFLDNKAAYPLIEGLEPKSQNLKQLFETREELTKVNNAFREKVTALDPVFHKSGDIALDVSKYEQEFKGRKNKGWMNKVKDWITPYSHAAVNMNTKEGVKRSHAYTCW